MVAIWGTNFVFIRIGLDELSPFTFAALRFCLVAFPLVLLLPKPSTSWLNLISYGLFIGLGQFGLLFWAMNGDISPGLASLIIQMQVFFTVLLSAAVFKEAVSKVQLVSLLICFVGLMIIIVFTDATTSLWGISIVLVAGLSWACGNLVVKQAGAVNILPFIVWSSLFSIPPLFILAFFGEGGSEIFNDIARLSLSGWLVVLWQSIGNTMLGYGLWNLLLGRYSAASVTPWALLVPVFGMAASAIALNEAMPWWKWLAASLIMLGLIINGTSKTIKPRKLKP